MKIVKYTVVRCNELGDLISKVNRKIADDWEPLGHVVTWYHVNDHYRGYLQTLVKYDRRVK